MIASFSVKGVMDESNKRLPTDDKGKNLTPKRSGIYSNTFADHTFGVSLIGNYQVRDSVSGKPAESLPTRRSYASPSATGRARSAASTAWA
jgi:hypothetical protein